MYKNKISHFLDYTNYINNHEFDFGSELTRAGYLDTCKFCE